MKKVFKEEEKKRISEFYSIMQSLKKDISYANIISHMNYGQFEEAFKAAIENEDHYQRFSMLMPFLKLLRMAMFVYDLDMALMKEYNNYEKRLTLMGVTLEEAEKIYEDGGPF